MQETASSQLPPLQFNTFLHHFQQMMGPYGLYQHATYATPLLSEGYCTDDNARAVTMLLWLHPLLSIDEQPLIEPLLEQCWKFILDAQDSGGDFYNFRSAEGKWLPMGRSEDMYARIVRAAVTILTHDTHKVRLEQARTLLSSLLVSGKFQTFTAPRFWAETLVCMNLLPKQDFNLFKAHSLVRQGVSHLQKLWEQYSSADWPWFEETMTYGNALLPHGLLAALQLVPDPVIENIVRESTAFLVKTTIKNGIFMPVGNNAWYSKGGNPAIEHQQPIEASLMLDFLLDYTKSYPNTLALEELTTPYTWFFGANSTKVVMGDITTGACRDGLFSGGANQNLGAESMLAYQWAEIKARQSTPLIQTAITTSLQLLQP